MTNRIAALLTGLLLAAAPLAAQSPFIDIAPPDEPGSELRVWLITIGPGEAVWERFGHNAIRVANVDTGRDVSYNWGIFDFDQPGFIPRFLKGEMLYMTAPFQSGPMLEAYAEMGRDVVMQELALTPGQRLALAEYADWNALPENRDYRYDYFRDNCSTRVRDLLDRALDGALARRFQAEPSGSSWRWQIRRLTGDDPLLYTGMDVLLGTPGDRPISVWEEMFIPMTLRDAVREVSVPDGAGGERPLVISEKQAVPATYPPEPEAPPSWLAWYLLLGVALGGALAWTGTRAAAGAGWARWAFGAAGAAWSLLAGFVGTLLVLVLATDHVFMYRNENLFLLEPFSLALVVLVPLAVRRAGRLAERTALLVLALALLGLVAKLLPGTAQDNAIFLALVLPAHLGLWWGLRALGARG
ncbi:MAG TPA: DUF4105 domain-containing protein [Longimicrobiales bacterium]|nr:DUF4105 domain-containing protein [Longimicrobiales bacterium]